MSINSLVGGATLGVERGLCGIRRSASEIARSVQGVHPSARARDLDRSLVEMKRHAAQAGAATKALRAHDDVLGTLLDVRA
jgi:hypothetical protein